jgi:hypothetical protein
MVSHNIHATVTLLKNTRALLHATATNQWVPAMKLIPWFAAALLAASSAADADSVTYDFTGVLAADPQGSFAGIARDTVVTGTFTFNIANANPGQSLLPVSQTSPWSAQEVTGSSLGTTPSNAYVFSDVIHFGNYSYSTGAPGPFISQTYVQGNTPLNYPGYQYIMLDAQYQTAVDIAQLTVELSDFNGTSPQWGPDGLPLPITGPDPNAFGTLAIVANGVETGSILFELTSLTPAPVPLPAAAWLLLSGLAGFSLCARKRAALT